MIDIYAPIIPYKSAGGFVIGSAKEDIEEKLKGVDASKQEFKYYFVYCIKNIIELAISKEDNTLFRITLLADYQGKLFNKISTKTTEEEFMQIEPSFVYDDFQEIFESPKGVIIETTVDTGEAAWITIFSEDAE